MNLEEFAIPEIQTVLSKEGGGIVGGWFYEEQQPNVSSAEKSRAKTVVQFSILNTHDISKGDILTSDNKRYEVVKVFKNLTHKDLSLKEADG